VAFIFIFAQFSVDMEFGSEPDIIKNSLQPAEEEFGPNLIRLRVTQQIRELQTVIRDKCVLRIPAVVRGKLLECRSVAEVVVN